MSLRKKHGASVVDMSTVETIRALGRGRRRPEEDFRRSSRSNHQPRMLEIMEMVVPRALARHVGKKEILAAGIVTLTRRTALDRGSAVEESGRAGSSYIPSVGIPARTSRDSRRLVATPSTQRRWGSLKYAIKIEPRTSRIRTAPGGMGFVRTEIQGRHR